VNILNKKPDISVFFPIYNEEKILDYHLRRIRWVFERLPYTYEIFVVDDSSTDWSPRILKEISAVDPRVKHLRYENGPSRRENLAQSFKKANADIVLFMDMDLATNTDSLPNLITGIKEGYDIVIGSRYIPGAVIKRKIYRRLISFFFNHIVRLYLGSKLNDHQCGFKAFKKNVIVDIVAEMGYDTKLRRGFFWDTEMLLRAQKHNFRIKEIPVEWTEADRSTVKLNREGKIIPYMFDLKRRLKQEYVKNVS
jgi:glycosyltransferase involved in cell wall biosynthesis